MIVAVIAVDMAAIVAESKLSRTRTPRIEGADPVVTTIIAVAGGYGGAQRSGYDDNRGGGGGMACSAVVMTAVAFSGAAGT